MKVILSVKRCAWRFRISKNVSVQCREEHGHSDEHVAWLKTVDHGVLVWIGGNVLDPTLKVQD
jgi:hypothetical protein